MSTLTADETVILNEAKRSGYLRLIRNANLRSLAKLQTRSSFLVNIVNPQGSWCRLETSQTEDEAINEDNSSARTH
jgi:hypothetical protein